MMRRRSSRNSFSASRLLILLILILASFLRFYRLDAQSFWNDEGNSARIAERTPGLIIAGAEGDVHPPGYYLLLHYWRALVGPSEFTLRSLSVAAGLLLVMFTYRLGRRLFGEATGLMAAFLGAISPFAIYYSQEARMYALLATLAASATQSAFRLFASHASRPVTYRSLAAYVLTSVAGLYTHYAFPFVLVVHNVAFSLWWLANCLRSAPAWATSRTGASASRGSIVRTGASVSIGWVVLWIGSQLAILGLYLPWLPAMLRSTIGRPAAGRTYATGQAIVDIFRILSVGTTLPIEDATAALVGAGLALVAGFWRHSPTSGHTQKHPAHKPHRAGKESWLNVANIALYLLLPVALILALDLYKPAWLKFLVVVLPPFHILIAHGIDNLTTRTARLLGGPGHRPSIPVRPLALALFAIVTVPSLQNLYFDPAYARDDYRQIAADIAASAPSGEAIILNAPNQWEVFTYYYPGQVDVDLDVADVDHERPGSMSAASVVYPAPYHPEPAGVERFMAPLTEQYDRLRVLYWGDAESDPHRLIEGWLAKHSYKADDTWYGRVRLATYGLAPLPEKPAVAQDVRFGKSIRLRGYALSGERFAPGDIIPVTLFWQARASVEERYKVTLQLLDNTQQLIAQHDTEPGDGLNPTNTWDPGQVLVDRYGILLPTDLSPGRYPLVVGIYHISTGERLFTADGGDHVILCSAEVE